MVENIFDQLNKTTVSYAVCVAFLTSNIENEKLGLDCFLIAPSSDFQILKKYGFKLSEKNEGYSLSYSGLICEKTLSDKEFSIFKKRLNEYRLVVDNTYGRIYELQRNSLSLLVKKQKREAFLNNLKNSSFMKEKNYG